MLRLGFHRDRFLNFSVDRVPKCNFTCFRRGGPLANLVGLGVSYPTLAPGIVSAQPSMRETRIHLVIEYLSLISPTFQTGGVNKGGSYCREARPFNKACDYGGTTMIHLVVSLHSQEY